MVWAVDPNNWHKRDEPIDRGQKSHATNHCGEDRVIDVGQINDEACKEKEH